MFLVPRYGNHPKPLLFTSYLLVLQPGWLCFNFCILAKQRMLEEPYLTWCRQETEVISDGSDFRPKHSWFKIAGPSWGCSIRPYSQLFCQRLVILRQYTIVYNYIIMYIYIFTYLFIYVCVHTVYINTYGWIVMTSLWHPSFSNFSVKWIIIIQPLYIYIHLKNYEHTHIYIYIYTFKNYEHTYIYIYRYIYIYMHLLK